MKKIKWVILAIFVLVLLYIGKSCADPYMHSNDWYYDVFVEYQFENDTVWNTLYYEDHISYNTTVDEVNPEYFAFINGENTIVLLRVDMCRGENIGYHIIDLGEISDTLINRVRANWIEK